MSKIFKSTQLAWNRFQNPAVNVAAPFIGMAVGAETNIPQVAQATTKISKTIPGKKVLSLRDIPGIGLRLRVM